MILLTLNYLYKLVMNIISCQANQESEKSAAFIMVNIAIISIGLASKASKLELRYTCKYICMFFIVVSFTGWYHKYCQDNETKSCVLMVKGLALLPSE